MSFRNWVKKKTDADWKRFMDHFKVIDITLLEKAFLPLRNLKYLNWKASYNLFMHFRGIILTMELRQL